MRYFSWYSLFLTLTLITTAQSIFAQTEQGYNIQLEIKPFKNEWIYLASYYGSIKTLADSAYLNGESKGLFKGNKPLPQGVYILASPSKTILLEMLVGEDQVFSIITDSANIESGTNINGSPDNDQFFEYTNYIAPRARNAEQLRKSMETGTAAENEKYQAQLSQLNKEILDYRKKVVEEHQGSLLAVLFQSMQGVEYPASLRNPKTRQDTIAQYRFGKEHYWDGVDFMDGRLVRTPVFDNKLTEYLQNWVSPEADSIIYEFNWMIALGRNDEEMDKYLIGYFVDHYMYPKIMGQDKVFLHVYENYIAGDNPKVKWLNESQLKIIQERAYMLMANQLGTKAWDIDLVDTLGKPKTLYGLNAKYTIVAFWDVHCGKCREDMPKMDTLYRTKWKSKDVKVYAVMVNESSVPDWKPFINQFGAGWTHVHQTAEMRTKEEKEGKPNFRQLYDMRSTPTLYLLDSDKNIIAKNISLHDLEKLLEQKFAQR